MHNELKIFGCNYRHYNLHDERWIGKDKISENLIANNYVFINNEPKSDINILGLYSWGDFGIDLLSAALVVGDVILGGPTGEGIGPAIALQGMKTGAKIATKEAAKKGIVVNVLLEVNMAKEDTKFGLMPEEVMDFIHEIVRFQHIKVQGLMTIAPFVENPEENRIHFANLRKLSVDIAKEKVDNVNMSILSMGMTNDFEVAIEEGATMVRIGTAIFGERNYAHQI